MATKGKRGRQANGQASRIIEAWTRLKKLEAMGLSPDDPRMKAGGEVAQLEYEIDKALVIHPWDINNEDSQKKYKNIDDAAGNPYAARLLVIKQKQDREAIRDEVDFIYKGPHPYGYNLEERLDDFEKRYGFRPPSPE